MSNSTTTRGSRRWLVAGVTVVSMTALAACGSSSHHSSAATSVQSTQSVAAPEATAQWGPLSIRISGVDDEPLAPQNTDGPDGGSAPAVPGAVFTFVVTNTGAAAYPQEQWSTPTLSYGPTGTAAQTAMPYQDEGDNSIGEGLNGPIAPGASATVREGFSVPKAQLSTATVSIGDAIWRGDFATLPAPTGVSTPAPSSGNSDVDVDADTLAKTLKQKLEQGAGRTLDDSRCAGTLNGAVGSTQTCEVQTDGKWYSVALTTTSTNGDQVNFDYKVASSPTDAPTY